MPPPTIEHKSALILNTMQQYARLARGWEITEEDDYNEFKESIIETMANLHSEGKI